MNPAYTLGQNGEQMAVQFLQQQGYTIRHLNWRHHHIELDIVAETSDYLVVVEVKSQHGNTFKHPSQAVGFHKIRHIVWATHAYVLLYNVPKPVRFDVISVIASPNGTQIEHTADAFMAPLE